MNASHFQCPCCGQETLVPFPIEEVAARFNGVRRDLIDALSKGRWMSRDALFTRLYGHRVDGGPQYLHIIAVRVHQLRKELVAFGYTIEAKGGGGLENVRVYRIAPIGQGAPS
jgi:hypothetical protein